MSDVTDLVARMNAEVAAHREKVSQSREEHVQEHKDRLARLEKLDALFDDLRAIWAPRLEALVAQFKDAVKVTPTVQPGQRQGTFEFRSPLAHITLRFTATTDSVVKNVILAYDLDILPIYMQFEKHAELSFPLDGMDRDAVAKWFDDRIVAFVKVYLSLYENEYYLKDHMVEDPVAHVRFPSFVAAATVQQGGKTFYFISEETRKAFETPNG
jgi:YHS domain-containing protein